MEEGGTRQTGWGDPPAEAPSIDAVRAAADRLRGYIARTLLVPFPGDRGILLKPENLQPTGSFKVRGVFNWALGLAGDERARGFSTFSAGNTARALALAARRFRVNCRSILPDYAPQNKVAALREAGVKTELVAFEEMADWLFRAGWKEEPWAFLHPWTEPAMIAGHATIGLEVLEDCPDVETVFLPVGGGALCAGVGSVLKALKPGIRVVAVQAESYPALDASLRAGRPVWVESKPTVCDGVAVPFVTDGMFPLLSDVVDEVMVVPENRVLDAMRRLALESGLVVEGAGALGLAAALEKPEQDRGRMVCPVTGGNVEPNVLAALLAAGA